MELIVGKKYKFKNHPRVSSRFIGEMCVVLRLDVAGYRLKVSMCDWDKFGSTNFYYCSSDSLTKCEMKKKYKTIKEFNRRDYEV